VQQSEALDRVEELLPACASAAHTEKKQQGDTQQHEHAAMPAARQIWRVASAAGTQRKPSAGHANAASQTKRIRTADVQRTHVVEHSVAQS
jgi:hypothetical protein